MIKSRVRYGYRFDEVKIRSQESEIGVFRTSKPERASDQATSASTEFLMRRFSINCDLEFGLLEVER